MTRQHAGWSYVLVAGRRGPVRDPGVRVAGDLPAALRLEPMMESAERLEVALDRLLVGGLRGVEGDDVVLVGADGASSAAGEHAGDVPGDDGRRKHDPGPIGLGGASDEPPGARLEEDRPPRRVPGDLPSQTGWDRTVAG